MFSVVVLQSCSLLARRDPELVGRVLAAANQCTMAELDTDSGLTAATAFLSLLNIPGRQQQDAKRAARFTRENRALCRGALHCLLELDSEAELHRLPCTRLTPDIR